MKSYLCILLWLIPIVRIQYSLVVITNEQPFSCQAPHYLSIITHWSRVLVRMSLLIMANRAPPPLMATSPSGSSVSPDGSGSSLASSNSSSNEGFFSWGEEFCPSVWAGGGGGGGMGTGVPMGGSVVNTVGGGSWTLGLPSASTKAIKSNKSKLH